MVKINGIEKYPELPFEFTLDSTEDFQKGTINLNNLTKVTPFDDYSNVDITINGISYKFILESDLPNRVAKDNTTHQITLLEEVVKLNDVQIPDSAFTTTQGVQTTWKYQLETTIARNDLDYTVDSDTLDLLNVTATNQQYSGSFLNFLVISFRAVDAIPTLEDGVIGHNLLNERNNNITTEVETILNNDSMESRRYEANINDYASSVYSKVKNGSYEESEEIGETYFPSKDNYVSVRSSNNKYTDANAQIQFNGGVRRITQHIINLGCIISRYVDSGTFGDVIGNDLPTTATNGDYWTCDTDGYYSAVAGITYNSFDTAVYVQGKWYINLGLSDTFYLDLDFTDYIYAKEAWDKLKISTVQSELITGRYQNNTFYLQDGQDTLGNIGNTYDLGFFWDKDTTYEGVISTFNEVNTLHLTVETALIYNKLVNSKHRFKLIPARDYDTDVERHTSDRVKLKSVKTNQQQAARVEIGKHGQANYQFVNRMGNDRFEITIRYYESDDYSIGLKTYDDIWGLNDYYNNYKVVKEKFTVYSNMIDVTYLFVKNQSNLNPNSAFTNPVSPFTIQDKIQAETCFVRKHYVVFGDDLLNNDLNDNVRIRLWNRFNYLEEYDTPIYSAVYTSDDAENVISMPVQPAIEGRGFTFNTQFNSKTIAGYKREATGKTSFSQKLTPINYTNDYGEVEDCVIYYCNEVNVDAEDYPIVDSFQPIFGTETRTVKLQPNEILGETQRIECVADRENLFIYKNFLLNNSLLREIGEGCTLRAYYYNSPIFTTDTSVLPSGWITSDLPTISYYKITLLGDNLGYSYAIADSLTGELYFAYNYYDEDLLEIAMSSRKYNPNLDVGFDVDEYTVNMIDTISLISTIEDNNTIWPIIDLTHTINLYDTIGITKSTNYEIDLLDTIGVNSIAGLIRSTDYVIDLLNTIVVNSVTTETDFPYPIVDLASTETVTDTINVFKSTNYELDLLDTISVDATIVIYTAITGFYVELASQIDVVDTIQLIKSTDYVRQLDDTFTVSDSINIYKSTNYNDDLLATLNLTDSIEITKSTNYAIDLLDSLGMSSTDTVIKSTDYVIDLSGSLVLSSTISSAIPTTYNIDLTGSISLSSTISDEQTATNWVLTSSTTYDGSVTNVAGASKCNTSTVIDAWLESTYPAENYTYGFIMRVNRANENLAPCTPTAYYYIAT